VSRLKAGGHTRHRNLLELSRKLKMRIEVTPSQGSRQR